MLIRSPERWAVAVRRRDGSLHTESHPIEHRGGRIRASFLRGPVVLVESFRIGLQAIRIAIAESVGEAPSDRQVASTVAVGLVSVTAIFIVAPGVLVSWWDGAAGAAAEAAVRAGMLGVYLAAVSRSPTTRRVFGYHGAEHMVIATYEATGEMPTPGRARQASPIHVRCGTDFLAILVIVTGVVFAFVPREPVWVASTARVALLPVVIALAYELMRAAARNERALWSRIATWPGRGLQRITTAQPADDQLEVALAALREVVGDA